MKKLQFVFQAFVIINTCILFATATFTTILFPSEDISPVILWQIPFVAFLCSLSCLIYPWDNKVSDKKRTGITIFLHYLIINGIVLASGYFFDWFDVSSFSNILAMVVIITVVFVVVSVILWTKSLKEAEEMNQLLQIYQNKGKEE